MMMVILMMVVTGDRGDKDLPNNEKSEDDR